LSDLGEPGEAHEVPTWVTGGAILDAIYLAAQTPWEHGRQPERVAIGLGSYAVLCRDLLLSFGRETRMNSPFGLLTVTPNPRLTSAIIVYDTTGEPWPDA